MKEFELDPEGPEHMAILLCFVLIFCFFFGLSRFGDREFIEGPSCLSTQDHDTDKSWMELDHQIGEPPFV